MKYAFRFGGLVSIAVLSLALFVISPVYGESRVPKVQILAPTGGEKLVIGKETTIRWSSDIWGFNITPENVLYFDLESLDKNGRGGHITSVSGKDISKGTLVWTLNLVRTGDTFQSLEPGRYKLTARLTNKGIQCWSPMDCGGFSQNPEKSDKDVRTLGEDESEAFTIVEDPKKPKLTILYPNGGENITFFDKKGHSQEVTVRWKLDNVSVKPEHVLKFHLSNEIGRPFYYPGITVRGKDIKKGVFKTVFKIHKDDMAEFAKSKKYTLTGDLENDAKTGYWRAYDTSDQSFTFTMASEKPKLTILYPNGGENIKMLNAKDFVRGVTIRWKLDNVTIKPENVLSFSLEDANGSRHVLAGAAIGGKDINKSMLTTTFDVLNIDMASSAKPGKYKLVASVTSKGLCEPFTCMLEGRDNKDVEWIAYDESDRFFTLVK